MESERDHQHTEAAPTPAREQAPGAGAPAGDLMAAPGAGHAPGVLDHPDIQGRGNAPVRAAALERLQTAYGNRAAQRRLQRAGLVALQRNGGSTPPAPASAPAVATPTEDYVVPFDRAPLSLPGEQVLFNDVFQHADPTLFKLNFTGVGGKFDSAAGAASKTIAGLNSGNLPFFIDAAWDGRTAVTVKLDVVRIADTTTVRTYTWTFAKKTNIPTTIVQTETEGERNLPAVYSYKVGPDINADGRPDYEHETILETFGANTCNITMADLKPAFKTAHPEITNDAQLTTYFFGGSGSNGTFTVDNTDQIYDQHGGGMPDKAVFEAALTTMKEIQVDLPQTYTAKPGTPLGRYTIRRILKLDGSKKLRKMKA